MTAPGPGGTLGTAGHDPGTARDGILFSAAEAWLGAAEQELLPILGGGGRIERLGPDAAAIHAPGVGIAEVADACRRVPLLFVRHLMREQALLLTDEAADLDRVGEAAGALLPSPAPAELALQVWVSGSAPAGYGSGALWARLAEHLGRHGVTVTRAGAELVLGACVTQSGVVLGLTRRQDSLADWPGGRVRLARDPGQVSRAELKLEELFEVFGVELPAGGVAVDLGASPGGWTRVLRRRGLTVWAVDPADLDPSVAADPGVRHERTTAGRFLRATVPGADRFDLAVNDMRMTPDRSVGVMLTAARRLRPGALAIMTLKLVPSDPVRAARGALRRLEAAYRIVHARQLHHNRNEVTVVARARGGGPAAGAGSGRQRR